MKKNCRRRCLDASVVHGAGRNNDHRLLRAKIIIDKKRYVFQKNPFKAKRWDVSGLQGNNVDDKGDLTCKGKYLMAWMSY